MKQRHSIELPFSISLFMIFVFCSFMVLLLQINGYHHIVNVGKQFTQVHTPLSYIKTNIRSHDVQGSILPFTSEDVTGLQFVDQENGDILYIYQQGKELKELRIIASLTPDFTTGNTMFTISDFKVYEEQGVLRIQIWDERKHMQEFMIQVQTN